MTAPHKFSRDIQALHIEHLSAQYEHLLFVRERHLQWIGESDNNEIRQIHQTLVELLGEVGCQYQHLIEELHRQIGQ